jgi:hypothetical protein
MLKLNGVTYRSSSLSSGVGGRNAAVVSYRRRAVGPNVFVLEAVFRWLDVGSAERIGAPACCLIPDVGTVNASGVWLVEDVDVGVVLPNESSLVLGSTRNVGCQQDPGP